MTYAAAELSFVVTTDLIQCVTDYCSRRLPFESGGLIVGHCAQSGERVATRFVGIETALFRPNHFRFRAESVMDVLYMLSKGDEILLATVHSHPDSPAVPSPADLANACGYVSILHMILSFTGGLPTYGLYLYDETSLTSIPAIALPHYK